MILLVHNNKISRLAPCMICWLGNQSLMKTENRKDHIAEKGNNEESRMKTPYNSSIQSSLQHCMTKDYHYKMQV